MTIYNDRICIKKTDNSEWETLDKFEPNKPFLARYLMQDTGTFKFDFTCHSITQLISNKIKWGIDSNAKIFDFKKNQEFKARNLKVRRVVNNIIWLNTISYPFEINKRVAVPNDLINQWATVVLIDGNWELYKFYSFQKPTESILL